jgi:hypothetical protein
LSRRCNSTRKHRDIFSRDLWGSRLILFAAGDSVLRRQVLVAGGSNPNLAAAAELYDPATGLWTVTGLLHTARSGHRATLLGNRVVVTGGYSRDALNSWEMSNSVTGTWKTGRMNGTHASHTATLLQDNTILVAGGSDDLQVSCEIGAITRP